MQALSCSSETLSLLHRCICEVVDVNVLCAMCGELWSSAAAMIDSESIIVCKISSTLVLMVMCHSCGGQRWCSRLNRVVPLNLPLGEV